MNFAQPFPDYELLDRVGAGAMGTVFKARQKKLQRIVAIKVLKPSLARDTRYVDRLRREARIVASLSHPNIVAGYDLGEAGGYHFFVMEFVEGKSLRQLLLEWGMFAEEYVLKVAQQCAAALDHAFERGVIHRDIKPGNILIDDQGNVKLTDMGLAKGPADLTLTRDGATVGTPQYISPEQARNPHDVDVRTDLYSLGATLYHMATGQPPFRGDTMAELITKVLHDVPVPPDELNPALSPGMSLVIRKLLAKDLKVRYQTPRELLDDLERLQRSLPVKVDPAALSAQEAKTAGALARSLATVAVVVVLAAAVWVGMQFSSREPAGPRPDDFLVALDAELRALPTPGHRLEHLRSVMVVPPPGTEIGLLEREKATVAELRATVDRLAAQTLETGWQGLVAWLDDPSAWPDLARWERERLSPQLRSQCGISIAQLPSNVALRRLDELRASVEELVRDRDLGVLRRFEEHLAVTVPARVEERVRADDFATAYRLWDNAVSDHFDGVRQPLPERLSAPLAQKVRDRHTLARGRALPAIETAESQCADALRGEVVEVVRALRERLASQTDVEIVQQALRRFEQELQQTWPPASRFRLGRDPWPDVERQLHELHQEASLASAEARQGRAERLLDLVWRTFHHGTTADALQVLAALPEPPQGGAELLGRHRQALLAAGQVADALVDALVRHARPVAVFPRTGGGAAIELRAEAGENGPVLWSQAVGQAPRRANLVDYRFVDLLGRLQQDGADPLAGVDPEVRGAGTAIFAMLGDELAGIGPRLQALGDPFLIEQVWPRVLRVREEGAEPWLDRSSLFARLGQALEAAQQSGRFVDVEAAMLVCEHRVDKDELLAPERQLLREAHQWLRTEQRRRDVLDQLAAVVPRGAEVSVVARDGELVADLKLQAAVMVRDAAEGWLLRDDVLEFGSGQRPWSEIHLQQLRCATGLDPGVRSLRADFDLVLPPASVGRRTYVFEFRGVAVLLTLGADDRVHAVLVDGDPRREDLAQRAFQRAMQDALVATRVVAVPGAVHRLSIELRLSRSGRAVVRATFEGAQVLEAARDVDPRAAAAIAVLPQQELALRQVVVHAEGM